MRLESDGSLVVDTPVGAITEQAPIAYQEIDGRRIEVAAAFELESAADPGRRAYRFRLGGYDTSRELMLDPVTLLYCGYIGGSGDDLPGGIAVDTAGHAYVAGTTDSTEATFPVTVVRTSASTAATTLSSPGLTPPAPPLAIAATLAALGGTKAMASRSMPSAAPT